MSKQIRTSGVRQSYSVFLDQLSHMKFTIALTELESLLKAVVSHPRKDDTLILSACAGRVFIEYKGDGAGVDALVFSAGAVTFPVQKFEDLLETYKGTCFLTFEWGASGLHVPRGTATATPTSTPTPTPTVTPTPSATPRPTPDTKAYEPKATDDSCASTVA
jgi:hypothetical protein